MVINHISQTGYSSTVGSTISTSGSIVSIPYVKIDGLGHIGDYGTRIHTVNGIDSDSTADINGYSSSGQCVKITNTTSTSAPSGIAICDFMHKGSGIDSTDWRVRIGTSGSIAYKGELKATAGDYAEMFEWEDMNANNEDRVGYFVSFDNGKKIKKANSSDVYILGIVSGRPAMVGNSGVVWSNTILRDEFDRIIYEEKELEDGTIALVEAVNPEYNPDLEYIQRCDRPEWSSIGMLGVLAVRQDGTAKLNGYVTSNDDGIATDCEYTDCNVYRVIEIVNENVCKVLFR